MTTVQAKVFNIQDLLTEVLDDHRMLQIEQTQLDKMYVEEKAKAFGLQEAMEQIYEKLDSIRWNLVNAGDVSIPVFFTFMEALDKANANRWQPPSF